MLKAIIFDIDGVLADSRSAVVQNTAELLSELGYGAEMEKIVAMSSAHSAETVLATLVPGIEGDLHLKGRMLERLSQITAKNLHLVTPTLLAKRLGRVSERYALAAASNRKSSAKMVLEKLGILGLFRTVVTSADAPPKPDPKMIALALERLGVAPEEAVFLGDNAEDGVAGRAAGVRTIIMDGTDDAECEKFLKEIGCG